MRKPKLVACDHTCLMCRHVPAAFCTEIGQKRKLQRVKRGTRFITEGEAAVGVYFVQEGCVKVHRRWGVKDSIVRFAGKGDIVGHRGMASVSSVYPISATALEDSVLCFVALADFKSILQSQNALVYALLLFYADELQTSEQKMADLVHCTVKARLSWSLLQLSEKLGVDENGFIAISLSKTDLAAYVGATYETVYRTLIDMSAAHAVQVSAKRFKILDRPQLERWYASG